MRALALPLLLWPTLLWPSVAPAATIGDRVRARDWPQAVALAAAAADPVVVPLVAWRRLLTRGAATAAEIVRFQAEHPDWPLQSQLTARYDDALALERDDAATAGLCKAHPPMRAPALLRCADAYAHTGADAAPSATAAWITGITDPVAETSFMQRWSAIVTADDQRARFYHLAWTEKPVAGGPLARQALRLDADAQKAGEVRLALRRQDPGAAALYAALGPDDPARSEPGMVLDLLRFLRQTGREADAAALWPGEGMRAENAAPAERQRLFWEERNVLIRALLRTHDDVGAYSLASLADKTTVEAPLLAGWIALRRLTLPDLALAHFRSVLPAAQSAIAQARVHYWLARAQAAANRSSDAAAEYAKAAAWPTTYYGQLAALASGADPAALGATIRALADPTWTQARALDLAGSPFGRAAALLIAWGDKPHARDFLEALETIANDPSGRALVANYATALGLPDGGVAAARRAARQGIILPLIGWPATITPPNPPDRTLDPAISLALIRQESSFDPAATSPAGAQGLMQLMPATAAELARRLHAPDGPLTDPTINMRLGTAYFADQLARFGAIPPALAAYNAGPARTREWLTAIGDPANSAVPAIDWIELIPYEETRNYIQRVVESVMIYRARRNDAQPHPVLRWGPDGT